MECTIERLNWCNMQKKIHKTSWNLKGVSSPPFTIHQIFMNYPLQNRLAQFILQQTPYNLLPPLRIFKLHSLVVTTGLQFQHPPVLVSLLKLYLSNPSTLPHATHLFPQIQEPSKWNLIIRHASTTDPLKALSFFQEMQNDMGYDNRITDDPFIYASLVKSCNRVRAFREGKSIHCRVIRLGLDYNVNMMNSLVSFYMGSVDLMSYASVLFDSVSEKSVVSVNCVISGNVGRGNFDVGLSLFVRMLSGCFGANVKPNYVTFVVLVSGCVEFGGYRTGNSLHSCCCKMGLDGNTEICNALIDFYAKFGCIFDAASVFRRMPVKDLISWNSMIWGYANSGDCDQAISLFRKMRIGGLGVDRASFSCLLSVCARCRDLRLGRMMHAHVKKMELEFDVSIGTALINMYAKCRNLESARKLFDELPKKNIEYWNAMIHSYVNNGLAREALGLIEQVRSRELQLDEVTILGLLMACRDAGELNEGILVHSIAEKSDVFKGNVVLGNALIDMYAKCGCTKNARGVFDSMPKKDVISWTSMIVGHAINGEGSESLALFKQMCAEKLDPNSVTFIGVLLACDHAGLVDEGMKMYNIMCDVYNIKPEIVHYGCVVDMLARAGRIDDAQMFIQKMGMEPNALVWRMLMNACRVHGYVDIGLDLVAGMKESNSSCDFVISSNIYAEAGRWLDVISRRNSMVVQKASKEAGKSCVNLTE